MIILYSVRIAVGDRDLQLLVVLVVFVLAVGDDARRRRHRQERLFHLHVLQRRLEVVDVALQLRLPGVFDRAAQIASMVVATPSRASSSA